MGDVNSCTPISRGIWAVWALSTLLGVLLIAVPDDDARVFSLSRTHGPSALDAAGLAILLGGWSLLSVATLLRWRQLARIETARIAVGASVYLSGAMILVPAIVLDLGWWWLVGALMMAGAQLAAAIAVSGDSRRSSHRVGP